MVKISGQEIEWNLNQGFGILILQLIDEVNRSSILSDMEWFNAMRLLFRNIEGIKKLEEESLKLIDVKMMKLSSKFAQPQAKTNSGRAFQMAGLKNLKKDLDEINRDLMKAINQAELIKFHIDYSDPSKSILK